MWYCWKKSCICWYWEYHMFHRMHLFPTGGDRRIDSSIRRSNASRVSEIILTKSPSQAALDALEESRCLDWIWSTICWVKVQRVQLLLVSGDVSGFLFQRNYLCLENLWWILCNLVFVSKCFCVVRNDASGCVVRWCGWLLQCCDGYANDLLTLKHKRNTKLYPISMISP